jgi:superfamily II DNA helicase RecQ
MKDCRIEPLTTANISVESGNICCAHVPGTSYQTFFFGYNSLSPGQQEIVEAALQKPDMMIVMPTGSGKSFCFQLLALLKPGLTVVISPLIALMQYQTVAVSH